MMILAMLDVRLSLNSSQNLSIMEELPLHLFLPTISDYKYYLVIFYEAVTAYKHEIMNIRNNVTH